jgi:hypothetical protein
VPNVHVAIVIGQRAGYAPRGFSFPAAVAFCAPIRAAQPNDPTLALQAHFHGEPAPPLPIVKNFNG